MHAGLTPTRGRQAVQWAEEARSTDAGIQTPSSAVQCSMEVRETWGEGPERDLPHPEVIGTEALQGVPRAKGSARAFPEAGACE